jgi:hypothetical protein
VRNVDCVVDSQLEQLKCFLPFLGLFKGPGWSKKGMWVWESGSRRNHRSTMESDSKSPSRCRKTKERGWYSICAGV